MAKDLVGALKDEWWANANAADKWKQRFECLKEAFLILTDKEEITPLTCEIADHKKAGDLMKILTNWLVNENHLFTRIAILRLLPLCIKAFPKKTLAKFQTQLFETIMTKQWAEKKKNCLELVTPVAISLWLKSGIQLNSDEMKVALLAGLKHRGKEMRASVCDFITQCTLYPKYKKQVFALCEDRDIGPLLGKVAAGDKDKDVKVQGCITFHALNQLGIFASGKATKKISKDLAKQWDDLQQNKRAKKNLEAAVIEYNKKAAAAAGAQPTADEPEEKEEKKKKKKKKKKKTGGGGGGDDGGSAPAETQAAPVQDAPTAAGGNALADDEKEENGKRFKKVVKIVTREQLKPGSGKEFKKGVGGKLDPGGVEKKSCKAKKPKKITEGEVIDPRSCEDNKKALEASGKFSACKPQDAFKKLDNWVKNEVDSLKATAKINDKINALSSIEEDLKKANKWNDVYDGIIGLASETMGWEGNNARNPKLAKVFLNLIGDSMANVTKRPKKDSGMFNVYMKWALQRLGETKFSKAATDCLLNTMYQYSPKVVFSSIEQVLFEPEDEKKDPFKNDKAWGPICGLIGTAVTQFGVDNFYVNRTISIIHRKMANCKDAKAKEHCYNALTALYQQLGPDWKDTLLAPCSKNIRKTIDKKFAKLTNPGTYTQLRCTKNEKTPPPSGGEMETIEEEVIEWVEIVPDQPAAAATAAPVEEKEEKKAEPEVKEAEPEPEPEPEPEVEPEPEPTPPPPEGPLMSDAGQYKKRTGKCKKLLKLWEQSKPLDKGIIKEYDSHLSGKAKGKSVYNESPGSEYNCGDMEKWRAVFCDPKSTVKKWKPVVASLCAWISAFEGTKFFDDVHYCSDLMLYFSNRIYQENPQPNVGKMMIELWKQLCDSYAASYKQMDESMGKMMLPIICNQIFGAKQTKEMGFELCEALEHVYPPACCYRIYMTNIEKTKSNQVSVANMERLVKAITDYGLVKCDLKKFKLKSKPYSSPKDFVKQFLKLYKKIKDNKTKSLAQPILMYCYEVLGKKFWNECKAKGSEREDIEKAVEDAEKFKKGKYRKPEKEWIGDLIRRKKKEEARLAKLAAAGGGGGGGGVGGGEPGMGGMGDDGIPQPPAGPLPGLEAAGFTPLHFTPQQLLALKYGPTPHAWKMNNFSSYVNRLPPAFCMDWEEFEQKKTTVNTKATAPYIKIGNVRIDVETGRQYEELVTADGEMKVYASMPPNNGMGIGPTGFGAPADIDMKEVEEKEFLAQTQKDDQIMADILGVERDNAEYFDSNNDGSSWLALYDVNGFDETDRQIQLIEMRNIYGVKTLQTWLHTGKNVSIVESSVNKLLSVLLPWLKDLINQETLLSDNQRYEQTYQILQLLKFCSKFKTLKGLNKSELILFFKVLLSSITYDNINALFGHNYKRILGEINDVLIKSILNTPATDTLCVLISLLKECDPTNDSQSTKQYADACCKLIYKVIKRYDRVICQSSDRVQAVYIEIVKYFSTISFETWQMAEAQRRFPLKVMQMVIARLVWFCGSMSGSHLNAAIEKIQNATKHSKDINNAATHQRDTYAKRLIMNFIAVCENRRLQARPNDQSYAQQQQRPYTEDDEDEKRKPHNIKQAQSSTNNYMAPSSAEYQAKSTLQNVRDKDREAAQYARDNKIDLNFALWVGMTGRNRQDYVDHMY